MQGPQLYLMLGLVVLTMLIIWGLTKLKKAVPATLVAVLAIFGIVLFFVFETRTVGDIASIQRGFPPFQIPMLSVNWETFMLILLYTAIMAGVGLIESLLTLNIIDQIIETEGRSNKKCVAQGSADIHAGFLS